MQPPTHKATLQRCDPLLIKMVQAWGAPVINSLTGFSAVQPVFVTTGVRSSVRAISLLLGISLPRLDP